MDKHPIGYVSPETAAWEKIFSDDIPRHTAYQVRKHGHALSHVEIVTARINISLMAEPTPSAIY